MPDLKLIEAVETAEERAAIDAVVGVEEDTGNRVARRDRHRRQLLLPALRAAQRRVGWVTPGALGYASRRLDVPPAEAYGVATFYALISLEERPAEVLHVCTDLACRLAGAEVPEGAVASPCLGLCELAPASLRAIAGEEPREIQLPERRLPVDGDRLLKGFRVVGHPITPGAAVAFHVDDGLGVVRKDDLLARASLNHRKNKDQRTQHQELRSIEDS